jgi:hypothetical protein
MDCPCKMCNGIIHEHNNQISHSEPSNVHEVEPPVSAYDRIIQLENDLYKYGAPPQFIEELEDIASQLDEIDDKINKLQREAEGTPKEGIQLTLGEISKELF